MNIVCVTSDGGDHPLLIRQQYELRAHVFKARLGWAVNVVDGLERDCFDDLNPSYIIARASGLVVGCARLLPASGPTMLREVFPQLLPSDGLPYEPGVVESSRFCVDTFALRQIRLARFGLVHEVTRAMLAGILEWSICHSYQKIVTVTDIRFERMLLTLGWKLQRFTQPEKIGVTTAVAGSLEVNVDVFERIRPGNYTSFIGVGSTDS